MIDLVGCGDSTFDRWRANGLPQRSDGRFDLGEVMRWLWARWRDAEKPAASEDSAVAMAQYRKLRAALEAIKLQKARGELISRETITAEWAKRAFSVSRRFLVLPRQIAGAVTASPEIRAAIEAEGNRVVREALLDYVRHTEATPTPAGLAGLGVDGPAGPSDSEPTGR